MQATRLLRQVRQPSQKLLAMPAVMFHRAGNHVPPRPRRGFQNLRASPMVVIQMAQNQKGHSPNLSPSLILLTDLLVRKTISHTTTKITIMLTHRYLKKATSRSRMVIGRKLPMVAINKLPMGIHPNIGTTLATRCMELMGNRMHQR